MYFYQQYICVCSFPCTISMVSGVGNESSDWTKYTRPLFLKQINKAVVIRGSISRIVGNGSYF